MRIKDQPLLDPAALAFELAKRVDVAGSQAQWCAENQVSTAYLNDVLKGRRDPGKKILDALGLESVTYYRKKR